VLTYDDDEDELESIAGSTSGGMSTQTHGMHKQDKQKMEVLKKLEKQLNDDIKSIDDGGLHFMT
jgi:hypothetical protein